MQIILITPENRNHFAREMDQVFKLRHDVFNKWLKWGLPSENGRESDKYDDQALHLIALENASDVLGTWRMMPTTQPYMTAEVFPELLEEIGLVSSNSIWDLSRFAINRDVVGSNKGRQARLFASMASAVYEFGIMNGVAEYLSVQNAYITPIANSMLGEPVWASASLDYGATDATCYSYAPTMERLYSLRTQFSLNAPVLSQFDITNFAKAA